MSVLQYRALLADLADFHNRSDVPFAWPRDGAFALEAAQLVSSRRGRSHWLGISSSEADGYAHAAAALEHERTATAGADDLAGDIRFGPLHNQARHAEAVQSNKLAKMLPEKLQVGHFVAVRSSDPKMKKPFYVGEVVNVTLESDQWWITFQWWTAYRAKDGRSRNAQIPGVDGCYAADVQNGERCISYAIFPTAVRADNAREDVVLAWFDGTQGFSKTSKKLFQPLLKKLTSIAASDVIIRQESDLIPDTAGASETVRQQNRNSKRKRSATANNDEGSEAEESEAEESEAEPCARADAAKNHRKVRRK